MKKKVFGLVLFFTISFVNAQDYKFGKVSKEVLQEKFNPLDSSASATYLYKYRKTYFEYQQGEGFRLINEIHERIKIYNPDGFSYATKEILLYKDGGTKEEVSGLKAYTYNLVNGKVEDTKLKKDAIFKTEKSRHRNQTAFTMPNIKEGSVMEYKYKIMSPFIFNVDEFEFQHSIPIKHIEAIFEAPEYFNFRVNTKGFLTVIPKTETKRGKITFRNKSRSGGEGFSVVKTKFSTTDLDFIKNISKYYLSNIPALKEEPYVNNINNYRSAVKYELSYVKYPNSPIEYYSTTWEDVVKKIYKSSNFSAELDKNSYYKDDVNALTRGVSDPMKKAAMIFNFVKSKVKWNGYYSKYSSDGVRKAYKDHVGNVAEINLMLTSMLRFAGLNANPVLISTRGHGIPLFPTREGYNYVICGIEMPNNVVLLDATSQYSAPNILPFRTLNWQGRIIRKQGSSALINLYPDEKSQETIYMSVSLRENGDIDGMIRNVKTSHDAMIYRERYNDADLDDFIEKLENKYGGMEIDDFDVKNSTDLSKPVMETYKFIKESQADIIGNNIYFSPLFFLRDNDNPFKLEKREFPVDFGYPSASKYRISIKLPENYVIESMPEPKELMMPDNLGSFKYNISANGSTIQLVIDTEINESIISSLYYDILKEYFKQLIEKQNEKIVLVKI